MNILYTLILSFFGIFQVIGQPLSGTKYIYNVAGKLYCYDKTTGTFKPTEGVKIELYDDDFLGDDHMGTAYTDKDGLFKIVGSEDEGNEPEPYLYITGCGGWYRYLCLYPTVKRQLLIIKMGRGGDKDTVKINNKEVKAFLPMAKTCNDIGIWPKSILGPPQEGGGHH